jgi:hypothetical protein
MNTVVVRGVFLALAWTVLALWAGAQAQTFTYREPFGIAHQHEILAFDLAQPVNAAASRLLDAAGKEVPYQVSGDGKRLLVRADLAANAALTWKLVPGKPAAADKALVTVVDDPAQGWFEITNGLTGIRITNGKACTDETAGVTPDELTSASAHEYNLNDVKRKHALKASTPAPVQGLRLRDGRWTANGPNILYAKGLCAGMKVEFLERGPFETVVRVSYQFKGKPLIPREPQYAETSPGYPGGDGRYACTITVQADQPTILFDEDADIETYWRMNLLPEMAFDTARHPARQQNGIKDVDWTVPFDADYGTGYLTQGRSIIHLEPWGNYLGEYYWLLYNAQADDNSPVVGIFADKGGRTAYADASGPGLVCSNNWLGSGAPGGGFNVQIGRRTPDARTFPYVKVRWGLFVGSKGAALAPLGKLQPIMQQVEYHADTTAKLRNVKGPIPTLPRLNWEERSDWINVKTKVTPPAVGNGVADDTAALQAALDSLKDSYDAPNTIYLPPGTYRITRTLRWQNLYGKRIIGHGRDTRILWDGDGATPPVMFHSNGVTSGVLFEGIVWDGAGKAEYGVDHCSTTHYETAVTHRNEAFVNMRSGIVTSYSSYFPYKNATAEVLFDNCLFVNVGIGIAFGSYNALDNTVIDCAFYYCTEGIHNSVGNVYIRRCHFEHSLETDIFTHVGDSAALRCTSVGSKCFLKDSGQMFVMEDCHVDGWTSPRGAIQHEVNAPFTLFDCTFTNPPDRGAPVQGGKNAAVLVSNCSSPGTDGVLNASLAKTAIEIPPGKRGAAVTSAKHSFFTSDVPVPGKVFDARRDFGAKGDGKTDDTAALVATIKAARDYGRNALAYLPCGQYRVTATLEIAGSNYQVGGAGFGWTVGTKVFWGGARPVKGGEVAVFHVSNASNVTLGDMKVSTPSDYFEDPDVISVLHTASDKPSFVTYNDVAGCFQFRGLGKQDRVDIRMINGIVDFDNCQRATIVAEQLYPSRHPQSKRFDTTLRVRGKDQTLPKDGFLGIMTMFNAGNPYDITVEDSQSLVISDYYTEQTWRVLLLAGNPGDTPGRFTLLAHKFHGEHVADLVNIRNYKGTVALGASFLPQVPITDPEEAAKATGGTMQGVKVKYAPVVLSQQGENPVDLLLMGCTYGTGEPVLQQDKGATVVFANDLLNGRPWHTTLTDDEKAKIGAALDHLRELGAMDLAFKALRGKATP